MTAVADSVGVREAPEAVGDGFDRLRRIEVFESGLAEVCGHLYGLQARLVVLVAEALACGWWEQSGVRSPEHWLCWQAGVSSAQAKRLVAVARRRDELPCTFAAFDAGELSLDQVIPIVERAPGWADQEVCELAKRCTVTQIRAAVGRYPFPDTDDDADADDDDTSGAGGTGAGDGAGDDGGSGDGGQESSPQPAASSETAPADSEDDEEPHPDDPLPEAPGWREFFSFVRDTDGSWRVSGRVGADVGLVIDAAMREIADALLRESGRVPTGVEVLAEMARRSLDTVTDSARRDRYRVHVQLDERRQLIDPLGHCLPGWLRELITCDATMAVTWTRHGTPIAQGSTADTIPAATRRHVLARDGSCRVPGCGTTRRLDVHHVVHRAADGTNDTWNLLAICPHHHRAHHRGELGITGNADHPDGIEFTNAAGRPIRPNQLIRPPSGPPPPPASHYQHPIGERLHLRWIHFTPPRPAANGSPGPHRDRHGHRDRHDLHGHHDHHDRHDHPPSPN
jgi:hypothetical protein